MDTKSFNVLKGNKDLFPNRNLCIHQLFESQVNNTPRNISVIYNDIKLTYSELNEKANQLANYLLDQGLKKGEPVAVCLDRSIEMVIALLGILKAGGAYVPIDPASPVQRIHLILQSLDSPFVIATTEKQSLFKSAEMVRPILIDKKEKWYSLNKENPNLSIEQESNMYIIYTSGTTGKPKGVVNTHKALNNRLQWMQKEFQLTQWDRVIQKTPYDFDVSVWEFFWPLIIGATIVMTRPEGHKDPEYLIETIKKYHITTIHFVPSMLQIFLDFIPTNELLPLKRVICSGEALKKKAELQFYSKFKEVELYNLYGPTEAAVDVTYWKCTGNNEESNVPIGYPISNINLYIMDEQLRPVETCETGELYIGGVGLAKGYYKQPELTNEKFIVSPFNENEKLYKTGDLCRSRLDGAIEYIGRNDFQVKLRGFRIELAEIEHVVENQHNIKECIVCGINEGENQFLAAYVTVEDEEMWDEHSLRNALKEQLPEYMIPSYIVKIKQFPLSPNGKIDRKQLPNPSENRIEVLDKPKTSTEKTVANIWSDLLERDNLGVDESFLYFGGNSLMAARLVACLKKKFSIKLTINDVFEQPTIRALANFIDNYSNQLVIEQTSEKGIKTQDDLSYTQKRMWFINELEGLNPLYNIPGYVDIKGNINIEEFRESLDFIIKQNYILQSNFKSEFGQPYIYQEAIKKSNLKHFDLSEHNTLQSKKIAMQVIKRDASVPFDLAQDHLFRFHIYKLSSNQYRFYYNFHHIIFDGWSESVFLNNLLKYYHQKVSGSEKDNNLSFIQYEDYIKQQQNFMESNSYMKQLNYWKGKLDGKTSDLKLSREQRERSSKGYAGETVQFDFNDEDINRFERYCKSKGATLFMGMLALYKLFIYRLSNETDISVGIPVAGRNEENFEDVIGMFINTLTIRNNLQKGVTFQDVLLEVKQSILEALSNGEVPFEKVVEAVQPNRMTNKNPLFQYMFVFQNFPEAKREIGDLLIEKPTLVDNGTAKFDLTLFIEMDKGGFIGKWEYRKDVFDKNIIDRLTSVFRQLLKFVNTRPGMLIERIPLLTNHEENDLIYKMNQTEKDFPNVCLHELFEEQVEKTPNNIAAEYEGETLTYKQLDEKSNQLAHYLIEKGIVPDTPVGLIMNRSLNLVVSMFGILKAGGAYLPIEVNTPIKRVEKILKDAESILCITDQQLSFHHKEINIINSQTLEEMFNYPIVKPNVQQLSPMNLVSVYYTSGSTGNPKGVSSTHQGWVNRMCWMQNLHKLKENETVLQKTTLTFDDAAVEFFWPLMIGGRIALIPPETHKDPTEIINYAIRYNVSVLQFVPSVLKMVTEYITAEQKKLLSNLRVVVSSGEELTADLVNNFHLKMPGRLYNSWGATEVSIDSTCYECKPSNLTTTGTQIVSVGKPIDNNRIYVLDEFKKPVPIGVTGDLYIAGIGLARGYLNDPEKTRAAFIQDPFFENELMYKTGDKGYLSDNGNIMFIGREDNQIKIRGMRVELGEIEKRIREINEIRDVVVLLTKKESDSQLVAYYTTDGEIDNHDIKNKLSHELPRYMIPSFYMELENIPLNPNGKLDRKRLPAPLEKHLIVSTDFAKPTNNIEERVLSIWQVQLKVKQIGIHDNFFELGGHSLMAVQIIATINKEFITSLSVKALFDNPTISGISEVLLHQKEQVVSIPTISKQDKAKGIPLSDAQKRIWFLENLEQGTKYNMPLVFELEGDIDSEKMEKVINQLIRRHESLRTTFINKKGSPRQVIHERLLMKLKVETEMDTDIQKIIRREARLKFNLSKGPLLRGKVVKRRSGDVLILAFHHIIGDALSLNIIKEELVSLYNNEKISNQPIQYSNYTLYQKEFAKSEEYQRQLSYWLNQMNGEIPLIQLPQDNWKENKKEKNITIKHYLSKKLSDEIKLFSKVRKYTPFMTFFGGLSILLARISQQSDVVVGTPLINRKMADLQKAVGLFLNTLPLRTRVDDSLSFENYLESVKETVLESFVNQDIPFEKIVEEIQPERNLNRNPLFDVLINYQSFGEEKKYKLGNAELKELEIDEIESKFLFTLYIKETSSGFHINLSYRNDMFSEERMQEFLNQYLHLLNLMVTQSNLIIGESSFVTKSFNKKLPDPASPLLERDFPRVTEMVREIVANHPDKTAVEEGNSEISYKELSYHYETIANNLIRYGIQPGDVVAVYGNSSYKMIASILGVLHADAVFLNVDEEVPENRLKEMLLQSRAKVLLATQPVSTSHQSIMKQVETAILDSESCLVDKGTKLLDHDNKNKVTNNKAAYIFFTSGSTGKPKGILGTHNGLSHFIEWQRNEFGISKDDRFGQLTSITFDAYLRDILLPLTSGATICIPDKHEPAVEFLHRKKTSVIHTVPSLAKKWLTDANPNIHLDDLRYVFFSGESLSGKAVEEWKGISSAEVISFYGQTETTMIKAYQHVQNFKKHETVPLGKPLPDTQIYILNNRNHICGVGETGEVIVRTPYRTMGYLQNNDTFTKNNFANDVIYRTGDIGRYLPDGNIQLIGRNDEQIKIRGIRIDKNEIISAINRVVNIEDCYVISKKHNDDIQLNAYLVFEDEPMEEAEMRIRLLSELPMAMIPNRFISVSRLPVTKNGKVDIDKLSSINPKQDDNTYSILSTVEKQLIEIWRNILSIPDIKNTDNFFELGGHSLLIVKMMSMIKDKMGKEISLKTVFQYPTVNTLASYIDKKDKLDRRPAIRKVERVKHTIK